MINKNRASVKDLYPKIDPLRACILDRKHSMKLTWGDIGKEIGLTDGMMRYYATKRMPDEWPKEVRENVCRVLGITVKRTVKELVDNM